ncbi:MAG: endonuclease/exonuclease/phosphatase family protein [Thalassobaculaceae bacterium]|nr:endonuclease/exonuclease/phosphatase family protein [Thalassobaculaceae bacterium]
MRVLTWNTWKNSPPYEERLAVMTAQAGTADADVILLQEAFVGGGSDTAAHIGRELGFSVMPAPARSKKRAHGGAMLDSTNGLAILARQPVETQRVLDLPTHPDDPNRIAQIARIGALTFVNLHLSHLDGAHALRRGQAVHLLDRLAGGIPTMIGGDLNADPEDPAVRVLLEAGFHDLAAATPFATAGARRIDFLLCRDLPVTAVEVSAVGDRPVDGVCGSDHVGVLAALTLTQE